MADSSGGGHGGVTTAKSGVKKNVEHYPLACPVRPASFEHRDLVIGPNRKTSGFRLLGLVRRDPLSWIGSHHISVNRPVEKSAHSADEILRL